MRIEAYAFGCKGSATFLIDQNKTRSLFSSPRHETSWKEADSNGKRSWPLETDGKKTGNTLRETKHAFHPISTFPPDARTMTFGECRPVCKRRWEQTRMSLGADANVAGSRFGCCREQIRVCLVPDALTGIGNETAARVPQFSAYALRRRSKTYCFRTPSWSLLISELLYLLGQFA